MGNLSAVLTPQEIKEIKVLAPKLAEEIQKKANRAIRLNEKAQAKEFSRMVSDPNSRAVFMTLVDQVFRLSKEADILKKFISILNQHGIPSFFGSVEKGALKALKVFGPIIPDMLSSPVVWLILNVMRFKTRNVILPSEQEKIKRYLENCKKQNLKININHLGDMVLGEKEEQKHLENYIEKLQNPHVSCVSVKISTLYSQTDVVASEHTVSMVTERLSTLLFAAKKEEESSGIQKLIYLDMEEYRDLLLTVEIFKSFLQNPAFNSFSLGIALQAYIPDSYKYQQILTHLAITRLSKGGVPIRIRIVKGANMEMEKCIASLNGWEQAPYTTKIETDANFKRMVAFAFQTNNLKAVKIGIGSHNIFEIAFSKTLQTIRRLDPSDFDFEMLEGIANHTRRSVQNLIGPVLVYTPVTSKDEFLNAIAYLVRRLVENTDKENFLSHSFDLNVGTPAWNEEMKKFLSALDHVSILAPSSPRHKQDRTQNNNLPHEKTYEIENFLPNSPTNFALTHNQNWLKNKIIEDHSSIFHFQKIIPMKIGGETIHEERHLLPCRDLSHKDRVIAHFPCANRHDLTRAVRFSCESKVNRWDQDENYRLDILERVAQEIEKNRASLISCAMKNVAKGISEADAEVSEAIDFVRYYSSALTFFRNHYPKVLLNKKGVILVIPPWNFPIAIATGGIVAALVTGNRVIIKPSPFSLLATWEVVKLFWKAGVPDSALQFIPCKDRDAPLLTNNPKIEQIIFTGSGKTADKILGDRPNLEFSGETSGKNTFIVTDSADKELAIKHLVDSAFSYNGQKCSAASIAILTKEVYSDQKFKNQLKDAVESLHVGVLESNPQNKITPLITFPKKELLKALTELESGEEWLVKPKTYEIDNLWSPGLKWGVQPRNFTHLNEFFGPVLGIMKANDIKHACSLANQTEFGLTAGIHSLDEEEINYFNENIQAGNLYVNSKTTGAIVGRQPFGGIKNSRRGAGGKAGGINYILQFANLEEEYLTQKTNDIDFSTSPIKSLILRLENINWSRENYFIDLKYDIHRALHGAKSCQKQYSIYFSREHSLSEMQQVSGQTNSFRYRRVGNYTIRVLSEDSLSDILLRLFAGLIAGNKIVISIPLQMQQSRIASFLTSDYLESIHNKFTLNFETDEELCNKIHSKSMERLSYTHPKNIPHNIYKAANQMNLPIFRHKPVTEGRFLMLEQYFEQSISHTYHRYGNLGFEQFKIKHSSRRNEELQNEKISPKKSEVELLKEFV